MVLDEADRAWIRYVASRDQLLAARDADIRSRRPRRLWERCPDDLGEVDLRVADSRSRPRRR